MMSLMMGRLKSAWNKDSSLLRHTGHLDRLFVNGLRMSVAMKWSGSKAGKSCKHIDRRSRTPFCTQLVHSAIVV